MKRRTDAVEIMEDTISDDPQFSFNPFALYNAYLSCQSSSQRSDHRTRTATRK